MLPRCETAQAQSNAPVPAHYPEWMLLPYWCVSDGCSAQNSLSFFSTRATRRSAVPFILLMLKTAPPPHSISQCRPPQGGYRCRASGRVGPWIRVFRARRDSATRDALVAPIVIRRTAVRKGARASPEHSLGQVTPQCRAAERDRADVPGAPGQGIDANRAVTPSSRRQPVLSQERPSYSAALGCSPAGVCGAAGARMPEAGLSRSRMAWNMT